MKIIGITRVRNEGEIINNTLNHVSQLVDGIFVYDDASTDNTVEICKAHPKVIEVVEGKTWAKTPKERNHAEGNLRQIVYERALKAGADWVYYFDADEYIEFDDLKFDCDAYFFRLFDFYITPEDVDKNYLEREFMGPEYRDIPMLFKAKPNIKFTQRVPLNIGNNIKMGGYVKHYGKAISIEEWDKTCQYYIEHRWDGVNNQLLQRWKNRVGKAIHTESDFNTPLIKWEDRNNNNIIIKIG
jgi:glycosyltransferase involved in cell wall biosynthesis